MNIEVEDIMDLRAALDHLTPRDKEIVIARSFFGLPFSQIGRELGCSGESVNRRYQKALCSLRSFLERKAKPAEFDPAKVLRIVHGQNTTCPTCGH